MASAEIRIDQPSNPVPYGVPKKARDDILRGAAVILRNGDPAGVKSSRWTLLGRPYGSSAVLTNPTSPVAGITPDKFGTYRVKLEVNAGGAGEYDVRVFKVRDPAGMALPAVSERAEEDNHQISPGVYNADGWTREMNERQLRSLDTRADPLHIEVGGASQEEIQIDWGLPMAILESLEIVSNVSTDSTVTIYADNAHTMQLHEWANIDATSGWFMFEPKTLTGFLGTALEDNKIYIVVLNDDADSAYELRWRIKAP